MLRTLAVTLLVLCPSAAAEEAAAFRGDGARTGVYVAAGAPAFHKIKWRFSAGGPIFSSPVVSGRTVYIGSNDHYLHALDLDTGGEKWKFKTGARVVSSAAVSAETVFFLSYDGNLYALDAGTGSLKWKFATEGERRFAARHIHGMAPALEMMPDPFDFFLSSPVVFGASVLFGSGDSHVYCLDAATGALRWKFKTGDVVHSSPAVSGGTVFVGSWDTYLYALDAATGKEKWRFKTGEDHEIFNQVGIQASPAVADNVVYFGCRDSNFYAVDAATGKQLWTYGNQGSWVIGSAAVRDGKVYFATSDTGLLHALDGRSGAELFTLDFHRWPMFSSPALSGNMLYLGSHQGRLLAVDIAARRLAWSFETESAKANGPALTTEKGEPNPAVFTDNFYDDILAGIRRMQSVGWILSSPAVSGDTVLFGSADGNLYAVM
jgi:eukaryotic-like serine/threonine-protein kinase